MSEHKLQSNIFQFAHNNFPQTRGLLFHVPNGGKRNKREANNLKAMGVVPGIPDLLFLWKGTLHAFELKTETGTTSKTQKDIHQKWLFHNIKVHIIRTEDEFKKLFFKILNESK